jgi:FlhB-like protein
MPSPRQLAVALRYDEEHDTAPRLTAKGWGETARRIRAEAERRGVPVREDADMARVLSALELGETIPEELYEAVARILTFIYRLNREGD